jgi:hypothetical protein
MDEGFAYDVFFYVQLDLWKLDVQIIRILLRRLGLDALCYILLGEPPEFKPCRLPIHKMSLSVFHLSVTIREISECSTNAA